MYPSLGNLTTHITITNMNFVILLQKYFYPIVHSHCVISTRWLSFPLAIKSTFVKVAKSQNVFSISSHLQKLKQNYFIAQFLLLAKIESLYLLLAFIKLVSKKSRERETRETRERVFCCCCCCCCCCC